jgi:hypothetical protein
MQDKTKKKKGREKKEINVRDLKPSKDAKGGGGGGKPIQFGPPPT